MTEHAVRVLALCLAIGIQGCGEQREPMSVTGIVPVAAPSGGEVIITGQALGSQGKIETAKQVAISTKSWSARTIAFIVPADLPAGDHELWVVNDGGRAGPLPFKKLKASPMFVSHDAGRARVGQVVTAKGHHFGASRGQAQLTLLNTPVSEILSWSDTEIKFKVPEPAENATGAGLLLVVDGDASNELLLELAKPFAERVFPDPAPQGWTVEIKGRNFGTEAGKVDFGKDTATIVSWTEETITAKLPANVTGDASFRVVNKSGASYAVQMKILTPPGSGVVTSAPAGKHLELVLDRYDFPHLFGYEPDKNVLAYSYWNGSAWVSETLKPVLGGPDAAPRLVTPLEEKIRQLTDENAKAPNRDPKVLEQKIKELVAREQDAPTNSVKESVARAGFFPRAAVDTQNVLHVVFHDLLQQKTIHGVRASDEFTFQALRPQKGAADGLFAVPAFDAKNRLHVAFMDNAGGRAMLAVRENDAFKIEQMDTKEQVGLAASLAIDAKGNPHAAYLDFGQFDLRVASKEGSEYKADTVDSEGWVGDTPSLVVDANGAPHVAYVKRDAQGLIASGLRYATRAGGKWVVEVVEEGPGIGAQNALVLDPKGTLRLYYTDSTKKLLKVAVREGKGWKTTSQPLESAVTVEPGQLRVAVGTDARARIAYWAGDPVKMKFRILD